MISAAHDLSEGGLAQALVEMCLRRRAGRAIVPAEGRPVRRAVLRVDGPGGGHAWPRDEWTGSPRCAPARGLPCTVLGEVDRRQPTLTVQDVLTVPLAELRAASEPTLPALFD